MSKQMKSMARDHASREKSKPVQGIPLIVIYWAFGLGLLGYLGSRFMVSTHPLHWASGVGGLLLGAVIGYLWYLKRGDVGLV